MVEDKKKMFFHHGFRFGFL